MTPSAGSEPEPSRLRRWLPLLARLLVFATLVGWLAFVADLAALGAAFSSIPLASFVPAFVLSAAVMVIGSIRWRLLMSSFGARDLPPLLTVIRLFFVGLFYNTFVPGSVGGDVVRGIVTRHYFDKAAASYVVVVLERLIGFSAMGVVFLIGVALGPDIIELRAHLPWLAILLGVGVVALVLALASGRLARHFQHVPPLENKLNLLVVFGLSCIAHMCGVSAMYLLAHGMALPVSYAAMVLIMPIAFTAAFIPLNLFGAGTREVTLVALLGLMQIETERAAALSIGYWAIVVGLALAGGLVQLIQGRVGAKAGRDGGEMPAEEAARTMNEEQGTGNGG